MRTTTPSNDLEQLRAWVGRSESRRDLLTLQPVAAMSATLDREDAAPAAGDVLVEEMAAAASSLQQQADELVRTVSVFRLGHGAPQASVPRLN